MKIREIRLERFKRFQDETISFLHPDTQKTLDLIVLVGENGSGKSSILQAIAAALGAETQQIENPNQLNWPGFVPEGVSAAHQGLSEVTLDVEFTDDEIAATQKYYDKSDFANDKADPKNTRPGGPRGYSRVYLVMRSSAQGELSVQSGKTAHTHSYTVSAQFRGRMYAYNLLQKRANQPDLFKPVGSVFWYHEQRTIYSLTPFTKDAFTENVANNGIEGIRRLITNWFATEGQPKVTQFRKLYGTLFPGKTLSRVGDTFSAESPPIFFKQDMVEYELAELSGGERALLPIVLDVVQWDINNSVILIDELELHLHPPLQQTLLAMLPTLGQNNQFIITTHSDAIFDVVPESSVRRIEIDRVAVG